MASGGGEGSGEGQRRRGRLEGLKQIASYLDVSEPTVRRYIREEGLILHTKGSKAKKPRYYAYTEELDTWLSTADRAREQVELEKLAPALGLEGQSPEHAQIGHTRSDLLAVRRFGGRYLLFGLLAGGALLVLSLLAWWYSSRPEPPTDGPHVIQAVLEPGGVPIRVEALSIGEVEDEPTLRIESRTDKSLKRGQDLFAGTSHQYSPVLHGDDLDGDGAAELVVTYSHTSTSASFTNLLEVGGRDRLLFASRGHHLYLGAHDLDDDGSPELFFEVIHNEVLWLTGLVAINLRPRLDQLGGPAPPALPPDWIDSDELGPGVLRWHVLLETGRCAAAAGCLRFDAERRELVLSHRSEVRIASEGLRVGEQSAAEAGRILASQDRLWALLRDLEGARRSGDQVTGEALIADVAAVAEQTQSGSLRVLADLWRARVAMGRDRRESETIFESLIEGHPDLAGELLFEWGRSLHLGGYPRDAANAYLRGLRERSDVSRRRPRYEYLRGAIYALIQAGDLAEAVEQVGRYGDRIDSPEWKGALQAVVRWLQGKQTRLELATGLPNVPDVQRYWRLEILAEEMAPEDLLGEIERELPMLNEARSLVEALRAETLARAGRQAEAEMLWAHALQDVERGARYDTLRAAFALVARNHGIKVRELAAGGGSRVKSGDSVTPSPAAFPD